MGVYTGTVPTFLAGELPDADKFVEITNYMTASTAAWTTWVPTLTNLTLGNGTLTAKYRRLGKFVNYRLKFKMGSTSAVGTGPRFTLPAAPHSEYGVSEDLLGDAGLLDAATANRRGLVYFVSGSTVEIFTFGTTGLVAQITATVPQTWATNDAIACHGIYEVA